MAIMDFGDVDRKKARKPREPRREHDAYMTPMPLVEAIVATVKLYVPNPARIIEPSCGDGEFIAALRKAYPEAAVGGIDIRPEVGEKITALGAVFGAWIFQIGRHSRRWISSSGIRLTRNTSSSSRTRSVECAMTQRSRSSSDSTCSSARSRRKNGGRHRWRTA
jgi:hypothetical protein